MKAGAKAIGADELRVGLTAEYERAIEESDVYAFAENSGDSNPLHIDPAFAQQTRFQRRIVHGAFQIGLASALIGMHLPGRDVLLGSVNARFLSPLYFPVRVRVRGEITAWNAGSRAGSVRVVVTDLDSLEPGSEITMAFTLQAARTEKPAIAKSFTSAQPAFSADRKIILLTGASGGIGSALLKALTREFSVIALIHKNPLVEKLANAAEVQADIDDAELEETIASRLGALPLYGVVHCAWPGMPKGGLLQSDPRVVDRQLAFGTTHVVRLARILFNRVGPDGGRIVALGSVAGHHKPALALGAYSLGKSALEDALRLLAPEVARKKITINAVCPTFVAAGMNQQADELHVKRERAVIPMGRTCETEDIVSAVRYLLSPEASFISGQSILLSGAQL